jgi:co-chaperonin GroES (HSP10)
MATMYEARPMTIRAIQDDVIVVDMDMGDQITASGIVIKSDDGKAHGVKPRWCRVYKVGPKQHLVREGEWILVEHGRWTRKIKIDDGEGIKEIQKVEIKSILASSDVRPTDVYLGKEYGHGDSATIRPEDFGAR